MVIRSLRSSAASILRLAAAHLVVLVGGCSSKTAEEHLTRGRDNLWQFQYKGDRRQGELAIAEFSEAIRLKPESAEAYSLIASAKQLVYSPPRWREALADADHAIALLPRDQSSPSAVTAHQVRGQIRRDLGDVDGAIADFTEVLRHSTAVTGKPGSFPDALVWRGKLYEKKGDTPSAIRDYETALKLAPPDWHGRMQAEEELGRLRKNP